MRGGFAALLLPAFAAATNEFGTTFLEENAKRDGVITLPSGFQYKVLREGSGEEHPTPDSPCECHYEGRTAQEWPEGKTFDSSYKRGSPTTFAPNQVIKGWTEAMQLMVQGDKWEMYIPSELGYGDRGTGSDIGPGDCLVFTMEIIKINGGTVPANRCDINTLEKCSEKDAKYITKQKAKDTAARDKEIKRLKGMDVKMLAEEPASWLNRRLNLLMKMTDL